MGAPRKIGRRHAAERAVRTGELQPQSERFESADAEEEERRYQVKNADTLVIDGRYPSVEPSGVVAAIVRLDVRLGRECGGHWSVSK